MVSFAYDQAMTSDFSGYSLVMLSLGADMAGY